MSMIQPNTPDEIAYLKLLYAQGAKIECAGVDVEDTPDHWFSSDRPHWSRDVRYRLCSDSILPTRDAQLADLTSRVEALEAQRKGEKPLVEVVGRVSDLGDGFARVILGGIVYCSFHRDYPSDAAAYNVLRLHHGNRVRMAFYLVGE